MKVIVQEPKLTFFFALLYLGDAPQDAYFIGHHSHWQVGSSCYSFNVDAGIPFDDFQNSLFDVFRHFPPVLHLS
jgi:hypothetical protein